MSTELTKERKGCWTCKDRKVHCDRSVPSCKNCVRARRVCQGYGLRLSWPKENDRRRAIIGHTLPITAHTRKDSGHLFINTTWQDVELYQSLFSQIAKKPPYPARSAPDIWRQAQPNLKHMDLVQYFHDVAHLSLVTLSLETSPLRDILIRMALASDSMPGQATRYALLAVSSLLRSGLTEEAVRFKVAALHALSTSAMAGPSSPSEAAQHVATCMLLCTFEIQLPSESSGEWIYYVRGAMDIIQESPTECLSNQSDISVLADWVYYHDVLSRFVVQHWRHGSVVSPVKAVNSPDLLGLENWSVAKRDKLVSRSPNPTFTILNLLSEVCDTLLDPRDPRSLDEEYKGRLGALESRIRNLSISPPTSAISNESDVQLTTILGLYKISVLIYLVRASQNPWDPPARLDALVDNIFAKHPRDASCRQFFPMFILACEARTEEQRNIVLGLIGRTENGPHMRSMETVKSAIRSIWVQHDLHADSDLVIDYLQLMNAIISSNPTLPSLV